MKKTKITVVGTGYVGLSLSILLSQHNSVSALDILPEKIELINNKISSIKDAEIEMFLKTKELDLYATIDPIKAYTDAEFVIIATPTDYCVETNSFDTSSIEKVLSDVMCYCPDANVFIKSTIPIGYTKKIIEKGIVKNLFFSPEFLREGKALHDNLYPSRIIVGITQNTEKQRETAQKFIDLLKEGANKTVIDSMIMNATEAESVKLFANTYLAMRVAFFNELDTFAETNNLQSKSIIEGVCLDPRIGQYYNNPSFGYGGYCLPKDTKQLLANYECNRIPCDVIKAVIEANKKRKEYISSRIIDFIRNNQSPSAVIGIYRLTMKSGSDNFRQSAIYEVINLIKNSDIAVVIYEPTLEQNFYYGIKVIKSLDEFKKISSIIVANRYNKELDDYVDKVYTRDIYHEN